MNSFQVKLSLVTFHGKLIINCVILYTFELKSWRTLGQRLRKKKRLPVPQFVSREYSELSVMIHWRCPTREDDWWENYYI